MSTNVEFIKVIANNAIEQLQNLLTTGVRELQSFDIDCKALEDYSAEDIRKSVEFEDFFNKLRTVKGPALYWFEVLSSHSANAIIPALEEYKQVSATRATPALRNIKDSTSNILYVGKVKSHLWGRFIQHLGFYKVSATQGLQLFHWAKELGLILRFNYVEFDPGMADMMSLIEYAFAKQYHPIIGKHQ